MDCSLRFDHDGRLHFVHGPEGEDVGRITSLESRRPGPSIVHYSIEYRDDEGVVLPLEFELNVATGVLRIDNMKHVTWTREPGS